MKSEAEIRDALETWQAVANMPVPEGYDAGTQDEMRETKARALWFVHGLEWVLE